MDVKHHVYLLTSTRSSLISLVVSVDVKHHVYLLTSTRPSLISLVVSVDVKRHVYLLTCRLWRDPITLPFYAQQSVRTSWNVWQKYQIRHKPHFFFLQIFIVKCASYDGFLNRTLRSKISRQNNNEKQTNINQKKSDPLRSKKTNNKTVLIYYQICIEPNEVRRLRYFHICCFSTNLCLCFFKMDS